MTEVTPRMGLPLLAPGQAQKELYHNEAILSLEVVVSGTVEEGPINAPPAAPADGQSFLVGPAPTGAWAGRASTIAAYDSYGWRYISAAEGCRMWVKAADSLAILRDGEWLLGGAIAAPAGGSVVDAEARATIDQILTALRDQGVIAA